MAEKKTKTTKSKSKKKEEHTIAGKIVFKEDTLYKLDLHENPAPELKKGQDIEEGDEVTPKEEAPELQVEEIPYKGEETDLIPGAKIEEGDILYTKKKFFRKQSVSSPVSGTIKDITEDSIKVEVQEIAEEEAEPKEPVKAPFGGKINRIEPNYLLLEFPSVQVNLFAHKGGSTTGPIKYLSSKEIKDKKNLPANLKGSIVITDQITADLYPMLSTLGVGAVIANSIDYALFRNMIMLAVPIGIITGFGYTPNESSMLEVQPELSEDNILIKYIKSIEGKTVWFDGDYGRLVIPETKEPASLKRHKFKLCQSLK